jgi:NAD(P)-dependent dehydrogenase (short-subunit alcohol dehydrogenase family)
VAKAALLIAGARAADMGGGVGSAMSSKLMPQGVALVTGASRRIGRAIALRLAAEGYPVALHASHRSAEEAQRTADEIAVAGGRASVFCADLAVASDVGRLVPAVVAALGEIAVLVNNASLFEPDEAAPFDLDRYERHMATNLRTPLQLTAAVAARVPEGAEAVVVNIIDQRVLRPNPQFFTYTLSKSALWTATRTMAQAFAPRLRVNGVGPGPTLANHMQRPEDFAHEAQNVLLRRPIDPAEIADAVVYLVRARGVTGQMIAVDGGQHLGWRTPDVEG